MSSSSDVFGLRTTTPARGLFKFKSGTSAMRVLECTGNPRLTISYSGKPVLAGDEDPSIRDKVRRSSVKPIDGY
jgi:hypothetical protein